MSNRPQVILGSILVLALLLALTAGCDHGSNICEPETYVCGGFDGNVVMRCDSTGDRYQSLDYCSESGRVCLEGRCVEESDGDSDAVEEDEAEIQESDEPRACRYAIDCLENELCLDDGENSVCTESYGHRADLSFGDSRVIFDLDRGSFDFFDADERPVVLGAAATWGDFNGDASTFLRSDECAENATLQLQSTQSGDNIGLFGELALAFPPRDDGIEATWRIRLYQDGGFLTVAMIFADRDGDALPPLAAYLVETGENGGFSGTYEKLLEFDEGLGRSGLAVLDPAATFETKGFAAFAAPTDLHPSGWETGVVGTFERQVERPALVFGTALENEFEDTLRSFSIQTRSAPAIAGNAGKTPVVALFAPMLGPHAALEAFADRVARYHDALVVNSSDSFQPCYWRSQESLESSVLTNLLSQAAHLRDFGLDGLLVADGWQQAIGDWSFDTTRFPSSGSEIVLQAQQKGVIPGIWAAPLHAAEDSSLLALHDAAEWTVDVADDSLVSDASGVLPLNLDRADVVRHVRDAVSALKTKGFEWLAIGDTAIEAEPAAQASDAEGLALANSAFAPGSLVREGGADEAVGLAPASVADFSVDPGGRFPAWSEDDRRLIHAARRWFLQGTATVFTAAPLHFPLDPAKESLFLTGLAMMGGGFELQTPPVSLSRKQATLVRRLVPPLSYAARPLDVFEHELPERYHLVIEGGEGMSRADILGLLCPENQAEAGGDENAARTQDCEITVDLSPLGMGSDTEYIAYEFWTGEVAGPVQRRLETTVPLNGGRLIALRPRLDRPQFAGWNRHVSMGGKFFEKERWDAEARRLRLAFEVTAARPEMPFPYEMTLIVPNEYEMERIDVFLGSFSSIEWEEIEPPETLDAQVLKVTLIPDATSHVELDLFFGVQEN